MNGQQNYFSHFQASDQKNYFNNIFSISTKEFKIDYQNRKWNHPNRKWNFFSHFQASDQKTSFTSSYSYQPRNSNPIPLYLEPFKKFVMVDVSCVLGIDLVKFRKSQEVSKLYVYPFKSVRQYLKRMVNLG